MLTIRVAFKLLAFAVFYCKTVHGADPFEAFFFRFNCYPFDQPGCDTELTDKYPKLAWSYDNLTRADTYIIMISSDAPDKPELIHKCGGELPPDTNFNHECESIFFIPGFVSGICNFAIYREMKNQVIQSGCKNVFLIDWMWGNIFDLVESKNNFPIVAGQVAVVIDNLKEKYDLDACDFHIVGHSFGAHIAGMVGQLTDVCKITALDPSGVLQTEHTPLDQRIDAGDAKCVQVIHTNGGQCLLSYFGLNFTCGTIDFWVNGGLHQVSCILSTLKAFLEGNFIYAIFSLYPAACSHFQSLQYFKASINPTGCQFVGVKCDTLNDAKSGNCPKSCDSDGKNCAVMGMNACDCLTDDQLRNGPLGNYYIKTDFFCPYCDNKWLDLNGYTCDARE